MPSFSAEAQEPQEDQLFDAEQAKKDLEKSSVLQTKGFEVSTYISNDKAEGGKDKKEGFSFKNKMVKIGAAIIAAIAVGAGGAFFGFTAANNNNDKNNGGKAEIDTTPTEDSATSTTNKTETTTIDSENLAVTVTPSETASYNSEYLGNIEYADQTMTVEQMQSITTIEEWAKLSVANRAAYYILVNGVNNTGTTAKTFDAYAKQTSLETAIDLFSMGSMQDLLNSAVLADGVETMRIAGASYYYTETKSGEVEPSYRSFAEEMQNKINNTSSNLIFVSSGTPRQVGKDDLTGEKIVFTNITYRTESTTGLLIRGDHTTQVIEVPVRLMTGEEVIVFMKGYGIDGKTSPDSNYPY